MNAPAIELPRRKIKGVQFVIYAKPKDFPDQWVVRRWFIVTGQEEPLAEAKPWFVGPSLNAARDSIPPGLVMIKAAPEDNIVIEEIWL